MKIAILLTASLLLGACSDGGSDAAAAGDPPVLKIAVLQDGQIAINGRRVTVEETFKALEDMAKTKNGIVLYYREAGDKQPPANANVIFEEIVKCKLPISMSTKPDFSDVVMADGRTRPRS